MGKLYRRISYWLRSRQCDSELAEEMEFHRALTAQDRGAGEAASRRAMGNTTLARETARGVWIWPWLESFWQDLAYGFRAMRRQPGFTAVALLALGSAIGINTSLFTVFNAVALRPWPVRDPGRVVNIMNVLLDGPKKGATAGFSLAAYRYLGEHTRALAGVVAMRTDSVKLDDRKLEMTYASGNYFRVLGVEMERGRGFLEEEDRAGAPQAVVVVSYLIWQNQFGGDPGIVGRRIRLDEIPFTVVGVASRDFIGTSPLRVDVWIPFAADLLLRPNDPRAMSFLTSPGHCCSSMAARLAPGVTRDQAQAEIRVLMDQFQPQSNSRGAAILLTGTALFEGPREKDKDPGTIVALMFFAVTLVLLLACANVGNLLLARAAARRQEIAVRLSLGGSRARLIRQLMVESMALALAAASIGFAIAWVLPSFIARRLADDHSFRLTPDIRVLAYTVLLAVVACLAFGLAPALHGTRGNIAGALKSQMRLTGVRLSLRGFLLATQVAISVVLLSGAGLLVRGLQRAQSQDPGFEIQSVSVLSLDLPASTYSGPRTKAFASQLSAVLNLTPGLPTTGLSMDAPLGRGTSSTNVRLSGEDEKKGKVVMFHEVSAGYFDVLRIPVIAGRNFAPEDAGRPVMMINETLAQQYWRAEGALGKMLVSDKPRQIVGVVKDVYTTQLGSIAPTIYWPMAGQFGVPLILVGAHSAAGVERISALVKQIEPKAQVRPEPLSGNLRRQLEPSLYAAALAGALGMLALMMASVGMSGVFAYVVRQRTREIGVRMALGAQPGQIVRLVLASSARALAAGLAVGLGGAMALSRLMVHQLNGVSPLDPLAYAGVFALLIAAAAAATAAPARRAARVDPVSALRWE
jgi:macrolide transport system ATP-binding/permease protein